MLMRSFYLLLCSATTIQLVENPSLLKYQKMINIEPATQHISITLTKTDKSAAANTIIGRKSKEVLFLSTQQSVYDYDSTIITILATIGVLLLIVLVTLIAKGILLYFCDNKRKKGGRSETSSRTPVKMKSADLESANFKHVGALVLDSQLKGPVRHMLENASEGSIKRIQFDDRLNEIVDIGTNVERLNDSQKTTQKTTQKSTETIDRTTKKRRIAKTEKSKETASQTSLLKTAKSMTSPSEKIRTREVHSVELGVPLTSTRSEMVVNHQS
ncbi:hypothetical protein DICVIV_04135 [Dictyocaulus viviparus]|uniref:Uncharacterized protein n=1 Tax=Dictyocaulus viviparus TaxID=29172 RepID=A0A0D8Y109_DICVI|nr:hypothetical protein DICVIV_04135 [Dictyocaulus viviparus]